MFENKILLSSYLISSQKNQNSNYKYIILGWTVDGHDNII